MGSGCTPWRGVVNLNFEYASPFPPQATYVRLIHIIVRLPTHCLFLFTSPTPSFPELALLVPLFLVRLLTSLHPHSFYQQSPVGNLSFLFISFQFTALELVSSILFVFHRLPS